MDIPSQHQLIPNIAVLDRLLLDKTPEDRRSATRREMELLPYYLRGACAGIRQLELARIDAMKVLELPLIGPNSKVILWPEYVDPLAFAVDFLLFCLRRSMDALVSYVRRCPVNLSLPTSLHEVVIGITKKKYQLDTLIQDTVLTFWDDIGFRIKGYRDQANHQAIILSNCIAFRAPDGVGLSMLLPDDPEEKKPSQIRYSPGIPAMGFSLESLQKTIRFVNVIIERMIDLMSSNNPDVRSQGIIGLTIRGGPLPFGGTISGEPVPYPIGVMDIIS